MARYDPPDYGGGDPTVYGNYGYGDGPGGYGQQPQPAPSIPGWRKPLALVGWGVLIAALIAVIVYGIIQLAHGRPTPASVTTTVTTTTMPPTTTTAPTTTTTTSPPTTTTTTTSTTTTTTTTTTSPTTTGTTGANPSPGALPTLPPQITLPIPTVINLPPGL
ncbi:oligopeptide transporter substrate-binding protein [Mycobacterium persicum]|uniref:oligopeptide transporter substrate-binding protein n=1 Tax=Mycobacterium persicum TaxID=1487726 RepID=UPI000A0A330A|nr:oligopeptide transporter substrate-binding protein [Mycobacterium persicum]